MKKLIIAALLLPLSALAQTYPSPTFSALTLQNPLTAANGGTGSSTSTGSGSVVLSTSPSVASPTVTGAFTATGLVTTADLATQEANTVLANATGSTASPAAFTMPGCSTTSSVLQWTTGSGFSCGTTVNASTLGGATFATPGPIGSGTASTGAFTTLSTTSPPTLGTTTIYPTVPTNSALTALATTTTTRVTRASFATAGDAPALTYFSSGATCTLNSGAGDNGSQVQSADGKCWIAQFPPGPLDVREWGVKADSTTDNTTALQAAWTYGGTVNTDILLPPSNLADYVKFSSLVAPTGTAGSNVSAQGPLSALRGRGVGQSVIESTVTGTNCALTFNAPSSTYSDAGGNRAFDGFQLISTTATPAGGGFGVCLNQITGISASNFSIQEFSEGINAEDVIRLRLDNPQFYQNGNAIFAGTTGSSSPNQWVIINPTVGNSTKDAFLFDNGADIDIYGGDFEGNNSANTSGYSTVHMHGNPLDGRKGLSVFGGYYEANGGQADFEFDQLSTDAGGSHLISGVEEARISSTAFVTSPVTLYNNLGGSSSTQIDIRGSAFWSASPYTPSSSRRYFAVAVPGTANYKITGYDSNYFMSSVEAPWQCTLGTNCMNLPDGHIQEWGTATTSSGTPGSIAVTWPLACPSGVDTLSTSGQNGAGSVATGATSITVTGATLYTSSGPAGLQWQLLCH